MGSCLARVEEQFGSYVATGSHAMARFSGHRHDEAVGCLIMMVFFSRAATLHASNPGFALAVEVLGALGQYRVPGRRRQRGSAARHSLRGARLSAYCVGAAVHRQVKCANGDGLPSQAPGIFHLKGGADPKGNRCCFQLPCRSRVCSTTLVVSLETMRSNKVPRGSF